MRISLLLHREPFGDIVEKTLSNFLYSKYGTKHTVDWQPKKPYTSKTAWLCNPYLNIIFTQTTQADNFLPILKEYSYSTIPWKRPLQRLYCILATNRYTAKHFCTYSLNITPPIPEAKNIIIIGGNHRVRLLNRQQKICYVINKDGFNSSRTEKEISFRCTNSGLPIPQIIEKADDYSWYAERYITGTPVNRIHCPQEAKKTQNKALKHIQKLSQQTSRKEPLQKYCQSLVNMIEKRLAQNTLLNSVQKQQLQQYTTTLAQQLLHQKNETLTNITISQTHGDFQPGNILADGEKVWLIDWEYTRKRQSGYDALVYHLHSRFGDSFQKNLSQAIADNIPSLQTWPGLSWKTRQQRINSLIVFLLEELDLYLEENNNKLFTQLSGGMINFSNNIEQYANILTV